MINFCISVDSGCDLPLSLCQERDMFPISMKYTINGETFSDHMIHEECKEFYDKMRNGQVAITSQINPNEYLDFWRPILNEHDTLVHISLAGAISGSYNNALLARDMIFEEFPQKRIFVVDSTLASAGYGMLTLKAADIRDDGLSAEECVAWLNAHKAEISAYYTTDELKYLYRGGRVHRTSMIVGTALNINPILNLDVEGHLKVYDKARGYSATVKRMYKIIGELVLNPQEQTLFISHADSIEKAKEYGRGLIEAYGFKDVYYTYIGPIIGAHTGPGLVSVFFYGKPRV